MLSDVSLPSLGTPRSSEPWEAVRGRWPSLPPRRCPWSWREHPREWSSSWATRTAGENSSADESPSSTTTRTSTSDRLLNRVLPRTTQMSHWCLFAAWSHPASVIASSCPIQFIFPIFSRHTRSDEYPRDVDDLLRWHNTCGDIAEILFVVHCSCIAVIPNPDDKSFVKNALAAVLDQLARLKLMVRLVDLSQRDSALIKDLMMTLVMSWGSQKLL